jgi:signal transduction histidine kinase
LRLVDQKKSIVAVIAISTILITYLHYSTGLEAHALHGIYAELYYIPILLGALLGLRGALITYVFVSALYLPFILISLIQTSLFLIDRLLHLFFTGLFAFIAGFLIDRQRSYQKQLEQDKNELQKLDKLKSSFLANVSHELRTPMTAITGYTDLLLDKVDGPINEEQEKSLKIIASHSRHLMQLINNILDISKMETGEKITLRREEIDFKLLIESIDIVFKPIIKQKGLTFITDIDENLPPIYADKDRITQILTNLLSNAVKFTEKGGITIHAKLSEKGIKTGEISSFAEVCVEDTGIGIKEEDVINIFDKFTQVDVSIHRKYEGTGLGLNIVKRLVELHNGEIWVTSTYGEGSKFCFTLPLKKDLN